MSKKEFLKKYIRELVNEVEEELEESTATGAVDGYQTPHAFSAKKHTERRKKTATQAGYDIVDGDVENITEGIDNITNKTSFEDIQKAFVDDLIKKIQEKNPPNRERLIKSALLLQKENDPKKFVSKLKTLAGWKKTPIQLYKFESVNEDEVSGGKADDMTLQDIADKHGVSLEQIADEFKKGYKVEREHTDDTDLAKEIAMDHLVEMPDYYTKLAKMEKESVNEGKAVLIGSALPYNDIPDLYYDESTKKFIKPNYWDGKPVVVDPKRDIKWSRYKLTPLGEKLRKMYESVNEDTWDRTGNYRNTPMKTNPAFTGKPTSIKDLPNYGTSKKQSDADKEFKDEWERGRQAQAAVYDNLKKIGFKPSNQYELEKIFKGDDGWKLRIKVARGLISSIEVYIYMGKDKMYPYGMTFPTPIEKAGWIATFAKKHANKIKNPDDFKAWKQKYTTGNDEFNYKLKYNMLGESVNEVSDIKSGVTTMKELIRDLERELPKRMHNFYKGQDLKYFSFADEIALILKKYAISLEADELDTLSRALLTKLKPEIAKFKNLQPIVGNAKNVVAKYKLDEGFPFIPNVGSIDTFRLKSMLQKNSDVTSKLGKAESDLLNSKKSVVIGNAEGKPFNFIVTDGNQEFTFDGKKKRLVKGVGKARPEIKNHFNESINEGRKPKKEVRTNRWLELKNDETKPNKKLAVGLKELKYKLSEIEKFLSWYNKISKMNELSSDSYWKRTHRHIYKIKERIINIAQTIKELEQ